MTTFDEVGSKATVRTLFGRAIVPAGAPEGIRQKRTVRSQDADASKAPSGENSTFATAFAWPVRVIWKAPVARFQSLTVLSWLAVAKTVPPGDTRTQFTMSACA